MQLYKIELKSRFYGSKPLFWPSVSIDCRLILKRIKMWFFLKCKVFAQFCEKTLHLNNSKVYTNMLGLRYFWIVRQALINSDFENAVNPHESDVIKAPLQVKAFCLQRSFCIYLRSPDKMLRVLQGAAVGSFGFYNAAYIISRAQIVVV